MNGRREGKVKRRKVKTEEGRIKARETKGRRNVKNEREETINKAE